MAQASLGERSAALACEAATVSVLAELPALAGSDTERIATASPDDDGRSPMSALVALAPVR